MNALIMHGHTCKLRHSNSNCSANSSCYANLCVPQIARARSCTRDRLPSRISKQGVYNCNARLHHQLAAVSSSALMAHSQLCKGVIKYSSNGRISSARALQSGIYADVPAYTAANPLSDKGLLRPDDALKDKATSDGTANDKRAGLIEWEGTVLLEKQNFIDLNNIAADVRDKISELLGSRVYLQLVSSTSMDPGGEEGRRSEKAYLENWFLTPITLRADEGTNYKVRFKVDKDFGIPGAILVENQHSNAFLLRSISLTNITIRSSKPVKFWCNSWIYNPSLSNGPRIFFIDQCCPPGETPKGIRKLRNLELKNKRGDGTGERVASDRIYDYDVYNDLGNPDRGAEYARPVLGGSDQYPYPRRCRTGRPPTQTDSQAESTLSITGNVYVPRDEQFGRMKLSDFFGSALKSVIHAILPSLKMLLSFSSDYKSLDQVYDLYSRNSIRSLREKIKPPPPEQLKVDDSPPLELFRQLTDPRGGDTHLFRFPVPQIIQVNEDVWCDDSEFARQVLVGVNPLVIQRLKVFPPTSSLDPNIYGPARSAITTKQIEGSLEGLTVDEALREKRLFTLDYYDVYLPYIERINKLNNRKAYATRSIFFLTCKGTLKPLAIELGLPPMDGKPATHKVLVPPSSPKRRNQLWELAKLHVIFNDTGYHELVSHWLRSHASMEPFIIAANRQLSSMHPIYSLLLPHFKNNMNINATARNDLINSFSGSLLNGGIIEYTFSPGRYSMELSAVAYRTWRFDEQALPADLIKRGVAEPDSTNKKHGLRLLIEDYPFAVDALDIWEALRGWAEDYVNIFYPDDASVVKDAELQEWWSEVRQKGHADKAKEEWWPKLTGREELVSVATTLMWIASGHHAAVNFGQFGYGGFPPSRATMGRRLLPEEDSQQYRELLKNPNKFYFQTMSPVFQSLVVIATLEILSTHALNEEYLGQAVAYQGVTSSAAVRTALEKFQARLKQAEEAMMKRNSDPSLINRCGKAAIRYTIMMPSSVNPGLSGRGIPNSISI